MAQRQARKRVQRRVDARGEDAKAAKKTIVPVRMKGGYDAAQTTAGNSKWWAASDGLSARQANNPAIRRVLRNRSRYEATNNCYAAGIVRTRADDTIGTGPRLQLTGLGPDDARFVEREVNAWMKEIALGNTLLVQRRARSVDGESFIQMTDNPVLNSRVKLDLKLMETEQCCSPMAGIDDANADGIKWDIYGNPTLYYILRNHPGDAAVLKWDEIKAESIIHDFRADRPGQARGIPELTPGLSLFHLLRAYTTATLEAAESIANFAAVLYTDSPADDDVDSVQPFEDIELTRRMMTSLPQGWKLGQVKPEQPTTTYSEFKREIVAEIGRVFSMPFIVAAGDSSGTSYAGGRLDFQSYFKSIQVDRSHIESVTLDRILYAWIREARLIEGYLPQRLRTDRADWSHQWFWDGREHVDPAKESKAQAQRLKNQTTTLAAEYAKDGKDWEKELEQLARERKARIKLGLPVDGVVADKPDDKPDAKVEALADLLGIPFDMAEAAANGNLRALSLVAEAIANKEAK